VPGARPAPDAVKVTCAGVPSTALPDSADSVSQSGLFVICQVIGMIVGF
jgi:hypothetical protein